MAGHNLHIEKGAFAALSTFSSIFTGFSREEIVNLLHPPKQKKEKSEYVYLADATNCAARKGKERYEGSDLCRCYDCSDAFHANISEQTYSQYYKMERYYVRTYHVRLPGDDKAVTVMITLSVFKNLNISILNFNVPVSDLSDQELISLEQRFSRAARSRKATDRLPVGQLLEMEDHLSLDGYTGVMRDICARLIHEIKAEIKRRSRFLRVLPTKPKKGDLTIIDDLHYHNPQIFNYFITEIQACDVNDTDRLRNEYSKNIYGLLVTDEGFAFIPDDLPGKRLRHNWSSRRFMSCFVLGRRALMFNFKQSSEAGRQYIDFQSAFTHYTEQRRHYFSMQPCAAGLDHGLLAYVERSLALHLELSYEHDLLSKNAMEQQLTTIKKLHDSRQQIIHLLSVSHLTITAMDELFSLICQENGVMRYSEELKFYLDHKTEDLSMSYQENNDNLIKRLTYLTIGISMVAIVNDIVMNRQQIEESVTENIEKNTEEVKEAKEAKSEQALYHHIDDVLHQSIVPLLLLLAFLLCARAWQRYRGIPKQLFRWGKKRGKRLLRRKRAEP